MDFKLAQLFAGQCKQVVRLIVQVYETKAVSKTKAEYNQQLWTGPERKLQGTTHLAR